MKYVYIILLLLAGIWFVIDPFNWWPLDAVGKVCEPLSQSIRCTGKINFF
jgi:uncharacterized protein YggT (Ycf19 family)